MLLELMDTLPITRLGCDQSPQPGQTRDPNLTGNTGAFPLCLLAARYAGMEPLRRHCGSNHAFDCQAGWYHYVGRPCCQHGTSWSFTAPICIWIMTTLHGCMEATARLGLPAC